MDVEEQVREVRGLTGHGADDVVHRVASALDELMREYTITIAPTVEEVYGAINADPSLQMYGPTFQLMQVRLQGPRA